MPGDHAWLNYCRGVDPNRFFEDESALRSVVENASDSMLYSQSQRLRKLKDYDVSILRIEDGLQNGLNKLGISATIPKAIHNVCPEEKFSLTPKAVETICNVYADDLRLWLECEQSTKLPGWL